MERKFKNFSCVNNRGFKIAFENGLVVSLALYHAADDSLNSNPMGEGFFTFTGAEIMVFDQLSDDPLTVTKQFIDPDMMYDDYGDTIIYVSPEMLTRVLSKVSLYKR